MLKKAVVIGILSLSNIHAGEHRIVIHGHASHLKPTDHYTGIGYNEHNFGIGYQYTTYEDNSDDYFVWSASVNIIKDSYKRDFPFVTAAMAYRFEAVPVSLNLTGMFGVKWLDHHLINGNTGEWIKTLYSYQSPIGGVMPGASLHLGILDLNYNFTPRFEFANMYLEGFHYFSASIKFF